MSVIPPNLNSIYQNLTGYRKSLIRFFADRTGAIGQNDTLRWTFPKEIIDRESLIHYFEFTSTAAGTSSTNTSRTGTFFPRNSASIIEAITVYINGQVFENIVSYNHLFNLIQDNTAGFNYYVSGMRALENTDPSIKFTLAETNAGGITATIQGASNTATNNLDSEVCDTKRPLQIRNWIGFFGTAPDILDLRNVELVVEIRYASANIVFKGIEAAATLTARTPTYTIDNYYMTVQKINFEDDYYGRALDALKNSGNYEFTFKTMSSARNASTAKSSNPSLQFSTTAKYLTKLYLTMLDKDYDAVNYLVNQGTSSTVATPSQSQLLANVGTNIVAFNQSIYFQKNAVGLTEAQVEINGIPVYPFPQPVHLIKNNNLEAFNMEAENGKLYGDYPGLQSLAQWKKYGFLQAVSFEHKDAWKNRIISGYNNPTGNLLNIKWSPTFDSAVSNTCILLGYAERVVKAKFNGSEVSIEY